MTTSGYRRLVIDLREGGLDAGSIRLAARLASQMQVGLLGRYVPNPDVMRLAGLPFAREFRVLEQEWHLLQNAQAALEATAAAARRLFAQAAGAATVDHVFEVVRDTAGTPDAEDIVTILPDRYAQPSAAIRLAAVLREAAGALVLPARLARQRGAVVLVSSGGEGPEFDVARRIAASAGERLLHVERSKGLIVPGAAGPILREARLIVVGGMPEAVGELLHTALPSDVPLLILRDGRPDRPPADP